ncbi:trigger factor [Jatrophihabitans sp. GAS493]|uniref:trigger factor n=1 Tax=Jatrophihabitans sp. GAS493 TaxID=1907575 RepID=UPI000BB6F0B2|nr:trigger factor [Jatrophihabitans sp. GAS493]SOD72957.1 trigger factor [Jatrophihabitans sp. GAS493]
MKSTVETLDPTRVRLAVEVPFDELKPSFDAAYKKIGAQVKVPGFRPGKIPARVIDQRVGRSAVLEEVVNDALGKAYVEAVRENSVQAVGQPEVEVTKLEDGVTLNFTAEVDIRPEIVLPTLDGLEVSVDDVAVSDADIDEQIDSLRDRFGTLKDVERAAAEGDYLTIDLNATVEGVEIDGGTASNISYQVGSNDLVDGLDEAVTGKSAGDTVTFTTKLQAGEEAGKDAEVVATVNSVKEKELPALDDEFAQLASEFDTVEELREDVRTRVERVKALQQGSQARDLVLEKLIDSVDVALPKSVVDSEVGYREHDIVHSLNHDDTLFEQYLADAGKTKDEFTDELRANAERSVRAQFVLDAIADAEQLSVGDAELTEYLVRQAARYEMAPQEFANQVIEGGNLPALVADVRRNKALASVLEKAVITDASGNTVDLAQLSPGHLIQDVDAELDEA